MKIVAVCGMGIGTSILLKMNAEKALEELGLDGDVEAADIGTAKGVAAMADLILTSAELAPELEDCDVPLRVVSNFMDVSEIVTHLSEALDV
ncbi:Ascorbate-specific PTS system EIIB component [Austwickia sp. TVS 96-490-7B]|uniref:PTS sugar transporter subunit IIB n=1 Tax=Austwickia sp. TVS 96-490-7B TaxID=2830843 RepID=UPI001C58DDCA|nr:PTS sugar transporter subunit IIB [Austwickia sp. TVS 96-490-7B]MBW3087054.1 Ascorbate-specific PTS system EIIB component [Austwickia sp. TVS 96-490-7B]